MNAADASWILTSTALVLLMTPGLAFFYGGMTRAKSVLNMMMMSFIALATVPVVWVLWGYSMAFGGSSTGFIAGAVAISVGLASSLSALFFPNQIGSLTLRLTIQGSLPLSGISGSIAGPVSI